MMRDRLVEVEFDITLRPFLDKPCSDCILRAATCGKYCTDKYYKLVKEEPVKIQTEYEWVKERLDAIKAVGNTDKAEFYEEGVKHIEWLKENKPTNYQTCTKENTKVGDEVRLISNEQPREIAFIYRESSRCVTQSSDCQEHTHVELSIYEIDLNNTEGK